ncbi:hypothetical protein BDV25DRAFT_143919 [Aspergillus avenaceus]|uniref:Trichothecene 3-O-acetyltransferase-like N-terminal domain-containing protein n=1 Tax=Aspergillus avenaceus TaxID=36643 RepID=A0A5N6TIN1_ASPAV|nr:hypothetical protein BDV25DRAFT_143919 [Aspergillus avenaceus]
MADYTHVEPLAPLDLPMPRTYITVLLVFQTAESTQAITQDLQRGLDKLSKQVPWLSGRVFPTTSTQNKASLEIRSNAGDAPTLVDKGSIAASYSTLASDRMPLEAIPSEVRPVSSMISSPLTEGDPVFAASLFRFADQGAGLCVCIHHNATDATGFSEIVRLWARNVAEPEFNLPSPLQGRLTRLSEALSPKLQEISSLSSENIFALHPEYSKLPPALPKEFAPCTSKMFSIPIHWINVLKEITRKYTSRSLTTNALIGETSRLVTAVNGRRRISEKLSAPEDPYIGNAVLYSLAKFSAGDLAAVDEDPVSRQIAEVYHLIESLEDYKSLFVGWDLFGSRDLTITSWADLDLYAMDFGATLGKPKFVKLSCVEADGVAIILPRQRSVSEEMLEVTVILRKDDMARLEDDSMWQTVVSSTGK